MRFAILVACLSACWTGYTEPKAPAPAKQRKVLSPDCQETIEGLWAAMEDPPESFMIACMPANDEPIEDVAGYWFCVAMMYEDRARYLEWAGWQVTGACELE